MGSVKPIPETGEPVVVVVTAGEVVVYLVVLVFVVSQQVGVEVSVGEPGVSTAGANILPRLCACPAYRTYPAVKVQACTSFFSHWRV